MPPIVLPRLLFAPSFKNTLGGLGSGSPAALPNHSVKGLAGDESTTVIKCNCLGILPRHGEREGLESVAAERARAVGQKPCSEAATAIPPANANLGHVAHIFAYPRAEQQSRDLFATAVTEHPRGRRVEESTTREADDVVQKSQRTGDGAVLIVDDAVQMAFISLGDEMAGGGEIAVSPGAQFQLIQPAGRRPVDEA